MPLAPEYYTADLVREFPDDGNRYEVVWGELLVTPSPASQHQRVVARLFRRLADFCDALGTAEAMLSPADISWSEDTLVQPDVFVVPRNQARAKDWASKRDLLLVAEVLSPSTARQDRFAKRELYQSRRVPLVWLCDIERAQVEVWTPDATRPVIERERLQWHPEGARAPLIVALPALFSPD